MKKRILAVLLVLFSAFSVLSGRAYGQNTSPIDLLLLLDTSSAMNSSYDNVSNYLTGPFLKEFLRTGDTFHLIPFANNPRLDAARRITGVGDVETIIGRMLLQYPIESASNVGSALNYTEQYIAALPNRSKKIVLITTGNPASTNLVTSARARLSSLNTTIDYVQVTPGQSLTNLPSSGRTQSAQSAATATTPAATATATTPPRTTTPAQTSTPAATTPSATTTTTTTPPRTTTPAQTSTPAATTPSATTTTTTPAAATTQQTTTTPPTSTTPATTTTTTTTTPRTTTPAQTSTPAATTPSATTTTTTPTQSTTTPAAATTQQTTTTPATSTATTTTTPSAEVSRDGTTGIVSDNTTVSGGDSTSTDSIGSRDTHTSQRPISTSTSDKTSGSGKSLLFIILIIILALLILGLIIFLLSRRLSSSPKRAMSQVSSSAPSDDRRVDHSGDLASYAAGQTKQRSTPYDDRPVRTDAGKSVVINPQGPVLLNLFVEDQNTSIGKRNIHSLKSGYKLTVGGGKSDDFLIFLVSMPANLGEISRNGSKLTFIPNKPKYFPEIGSNEVNDCINKTIRIISDKQYEMCFRFEMYEDPLIALNRMLTSLNVPG